MSSVLLHSALAGALLMGPLLTRPTDVALAEEPAITVTTDSAEFCAALDRLLASGEGERGDEVLRLTREGDEMCAEGEVRGGIARLRRALVLWEEGQGHRASFGAGGGLSSGGPPAGEGPIGGPGGRGPPPPR